MRTGPISYKSIALTFVLALVFYCVAYWWLSHRQTRNGPWQVTFTNELSGSPAIRIEQPKLGVSNVVIRFPEERAPALGGTVAFTRPRQPLPFGTLLFDDLMFLPGAVTLDLFGHEIELPPRVLVVNEKEYPWEPGLAISLYGTNKLSEAARKARKEKSGYQRVPDQPRQRRFQSGS